MVCLIVLLSICLLYSRQIIQPAGLFVEETRNVEGTLTFTVRTVTYGGGYAPRNAGVIWITNSQNQFVKTIKIWAQNYRVTLVKWRASSNSNTVGAITSASLNSHQLHTVTWNGMNTSNITVPDGDYNVNVEFAEHNATTGNPGKYKFVTFTKGSSAVDISPANESYFSNMHLVWVPTAPVNGFVSGVVTNSANQPISGAQVNVGTLSATTSATGIYSVSIQPGSYTVSCSAANYQSQAINNVTVTSNQTTTANFSLVSIPLPDGTLSGTVVNSNNAPISGASISIGTLNTLTDSNGIYSVSIQPGSYTVYCSAANYQSQSLDSVVITSNQTTTTNFTLESTPLPNGTIAGIVTNAQNQPIAGAVVTAGELSTTTSATGTFTISAYPGIYNMTCNALNFVEQTHANAVVISEQTTIVNFILDAVANEEELAINDDMVKLQNYPNPFNESTNIRFYLNKGSSPKLNIYNTKGQLIDNISDGFLASGWHTISWSKFGLNSKNLPSGNYYIRLIADGKCITIKAIIN
jgi:flagellar hook assembly protein FlgD